MGVNHVNLANGEELIDLRNDTVSEDTLYQGVTAHNSKGEQITGRMAAEGGVSVQADYAENNTTSPAYIKNRPFYDERVTSHFSQSETPASVKFDIAALNYTFWKVSDLLPTRDEMFSKTKFAVNNNSAEIPDEANIQFETNDVVAFVLSNGYAFGVAYKSGAIILDMGLTINVPETGIYYIVPWGQQLGSATVVDIEVGEIKKIDPKFLPDNFGGGSSGGDIFLVTADFDLTTLKFSNPSASATEIINAYKSGKNIKLVSEVYQNPLTINVFGNLSNIASAPNILDAATFQVFFADDTGKLYYIQAQFQTSPTSGTTGITTTVKLITTTNA